MHADATSLPRRALSTSHALLRIFEYVSRVAMEALVRQSGKASGLESQHGYEINRDPSRGRVTLVGSGPGDPELLTIKAVRAIESADTILFDALVSEEILKLAPSHVELICVGKRGGRQSCRQDDINALMLSHARSGKRVVRLKAGDPAIFGRTGEEISFLERKGIEAQIIPGITSASAMAAAFGVSLTHRNHAKSVRFVTGHSKNGGLPEDLDWRAIADSSATTVFYMGGPFAGEIAERLIKLGMPEETPVGIATSLSRTNQQIARCTLVKLEGAIAAFDRSEPLLLGIGAIYAGTCGTSLVQTDKCSAV